jgi:hypothetical protein
MTTNDDITHPEADHISDITRFTAFRSLECVDDAKVVSAGNLPVALAAEVLFGLWASQAA